MMGTKVFRCVLKLFAQLHFRFASTLFFLLLFSPAFPCYAEDDRGTRYADAVEKHARLDAEIKFLKAESVELEKNNGPGSPVILESFKPTENPLNELRTRLVELLEANFAQVPRAVPEAALQKSIDELKRDVAAVHNQLAQDRDLFLKVRTQGKFIGQLASLLNVDNRMMWLGGVVAFGILFGLFAFDERHALRRLLWVRRSRAIALVMLGMGLFAIPLLPTIATFVLGDQSFDKLLALSAGQSSSVIGDDLDKSLTEFLDSDADLRRTQKLRIDERNQLLEARHGRLRNVFGSKSQLPDEWKDLHERITISHVDWLVSRHLSQAIEADIQRLQSLKTELNNDEKLVKRYSQTKQLMGGVVGLSLLGFVLLCGAYFQRSVTTQRKKVSETCPRCLAVGKLIVEPAPSGTPPELRTSLSELRCTNVFDDVSNDTCDFTFRSQYRDRIKVSFPTLGVASSGKTHWLAMVYQQLNQGKAPEGVHFERIQSSGSAKFDRLVTDILQARIGLYATQIELPEPLIFGFRDRDPFSFGGTDILVNMFDFAGTVSVTKDLRDSIRIRQLNSEGFLFFLDPSKPSDKQVEALLKFREEVKLVKRLGTGRQLHTPVALCLSKLDTTVYQEYARGGDVITSFFEELSAIDSRTQPMSLTRLKMRSDLVAELRDTIWPSWEIENQIRGLFGDRFQFFPMTPVGLPPAGMTDEASINDLEQRTIEPYGLLEPLLWLLHMNGYPVLKP